VSAVFTSLLPVFLLIMLGYGLRRFEVVPENLWRGVELLGYWAFFPGLLTTTMARADLASIELSAVSLTAIAAFCTMAAGLLVLRRPIESSLAISAPAFTSIFQSSTRWNAFIALPIAVELYGEQGTALVAVVMACLVPASNALNVAVLARYASHTAPSPTRVVYIVFRNPFIWATFVGLSINILGIEIYKPLMTTLDLLGGAALGTGLLMVGSGLQVRHALPPTLPAAVGTMTKLLVMPILVSLWAVLFGLQGTAFTVAIICASVPTAMNGYVLARQMGGDAPLQAAATTLQTVFSFATIPIITWLAQ
jgi:predicted permease